ncbi:acetate--CoA ligase [Pseudomonas sp. BBP2017]|uniref:acetate--CoA ligase n=1 Tax=Pseudomonas sp. BBP2017 TaxID=2109731 RepID=UPI000D121493|nr:acetate--CoA ligase [Pseudomonas sp. BBP2017]PSS57909.1 acetate--CoA ligase [Pseudomonas sp. BBP2017]
MHPPIIKKTLAHLPLAPNWVDSVQAREAFSWQVEASALVGLPGGGLNLAYEAVDRHAQSAHRWHTALRMLDRNGGSCDISYAQLSIQSNRFANVLKQLGVVPGERLFVLCARGLELYLGVLGGLKLGCVVSPLFCAFGPEPIETRLRLGEGSVLLTSETLYRRKVAAIRERLPALKHVLLYDDNGGDTVCIDGTLNLHQLLMQAEEAFTVVNTTADSPALLHFTSGTTGTPKGVLHVHGAALTHLVTGKYALDLHPDDVYWCSADPGWVTGTSYGIFAPLLLGVTSVVEGNEFDAERWYRILEGQQVTVWYTAPTAIRLLMKAGAALARSHRFARLRFIASVGEPLNPEAVWWGQEVLGLPIHDNWWQTETGGIMIANTVAMPIKPGSMGKPLPGVEAAIVAREEKGLVFLGDNKVGDLALKQPWPAMFRAYLGQEQRYRQCFVGEWYLSGDLVRRDADGYYWFIGRSDDVIKSAGHLIGPFEVENSLMEHPAVAEAAVIGKPDPMLGETVKAFVSLKRGFIASQALHDELLGHGRKRLGAVVAPKELEFVQALPHTRSGKLMRRLLKARELGLPEGDTSSMESPS